MAAALPSAILCELRGKTFFVGHQQNLRSCRKTWLFVALPDLQSMSRTWRLSPITIDATPPSDEPKTVQTSIPSACRFSRTNER